MTTDELVERAAKAAATARRGVTAKVNATDREVAVAVLAVFKQTHVTTAYHDEIVNEAQRQIHVLEQAQAESEWEYGTAYLTPEGEIWDEFCWGSSLNDARAEVADWSPEDGDGESTLVVVRRTPEVPAGPWEPVEATDE